MSESPAIKFSQACRDIGKSLGVELLDSRKYDVAPLVLKTKEKSLGDYIKSPSRAEQQL
jgi:hypothetical protein